MTTPDGDASPYRVGALVVLVAVVVLSVVVPTAVGATRADGGVGDAAVGVESTTGQVDNDTSEYVYRLPFTENDGRLADTVFSVAKVTAWREATVSIDANADGQVDRTTTIASGGTLDIDRPTEGAVIRSTAPVNVQYRYRSDNLSAYDDGNYRYGVPEASQLGTEYYLPVNASELWITPTNTTDVRVDTDGDGVIETTRTVEPDDAVSVGNVSTGARVLTDEPVHVVAERSQWETLDGTYLTSLLPASAARTTYDVPAELDYNHSEPESDSGVHLAATEDDTRVRIDVGTDDSVDRSVTLDAGETAEFDLTRAATVTADKPVVAVYTFDVEAEDVFQSTRRDFLAATTPVGTVSSYQWSYEGINESVAMWSDYNRSADGSASVTVAPAEPNLSESVQFTASGPRTVGDRALTTSYEWAVNGTASASGQQFARTFEQAGTYTVSVRIVDAAGRSVLVTRSVSVGAQQGGGGAAFPSVTDGGVVPIVGGGVLALLAVGVVVYAGLRRRDGPSGTDRTTATDTPDPTNPFVEEEPAADESDVSETDSEGEDGPAVGDGGTLAESGAGQVSEGDGTTGQPGDGGDPERTGSSDDATTAGASDGPETAAGGTDGENDAADESLPDDADLQAVPGIGPTYAERLQAAGFETVGDLRGAELAMVAAAAEASESRVVDWLDEAAE